MIIPGEHLFGIPTSWDFVRLGWGPSEEPINCSWEPSAVPWGSLVMAFHPSIAPPPKWYCKTFQSKTMESMDHNIIWVTIIWNTPRSHAAYAAMCCTLFWKNESLLQHLGRGCGSRPLLATSELTKAVGHMPKGNAPPGCFALTRIRDLLGD